MEPGEIFGKNADARRRELGLTQDQLKERLGAKSRSAVTMYTSDYRPPNLETVFKFADALECTPAYLLKDKEKSETTNSIDEISRRAMELLQDPERLAVLAIILSLEKDKLGTVRDVISRFASSGLNKNKPAASG